MTNEEAQRISTQNDGDTVITTTTIISMSVSMFALLDSAGTV